MQHNTQVPVGKHNNRQHASTHHEVATDVKQMPIRPIIIYRYAIFAGFYLSTSGSDVIMKQLPGGTLLGDDQYLQFQLFAEPYCKDTCKC